ncbi:uncharacterized protein METZ01_LOCUS351627, partial [marine metagenome]
DPALQQSGPLRGRYPPVFAAERVRVGRLHRHGQGVRRWRAHLHRKRRQGGHVPRHRLPRLPGALAEQPGRHHGQGL